MNGRIHKIIGMFIFIVFYIFNLFPLYINEYVHSSKEYLAYSFIVALIFSGGRINNKEWYDFGLSPDNDFHKKNDRSWIIHSAILPTIFIYLFKHPLIAIASFFYTLHIVVDLLNAKSWKIDNYISSLLTVVLFFIMLYQQNF